MVVVVVVVVVAGNDSCLAATALSIAALVVPVDGSSASITIELISRTRGDGGGGGSVEVVEGEVGPLLVVGGERGCVLTGKVLPPKSRECITLHGSSFCRRQQATPRASMSSRTPSCSTAFLLECPWQACDIVDILSPE